MGFLKSLLRPKAESQSLSEHSSLDKFLGEMVRFGEEREIRPRLPSLAGLRALEIAPRQPSLAGLLKEKGAKVVARLGGLKEKEMSDKLGTSFILSHWEILPFVESSWDFVLVRAPFLKGGLGRLLHEVSRILAPGGQVMVSDLHPFSLTVQREHLKSAVSEEGMGPGFERYFKWFREADLSLEVVRELFFEGSIKKNVLTDQARVQAQKDFEKIRKTPFLIFFSLRKVLK